MTQKSGTPHAAIEARKKDTRTKLARVDQALKRLLKQKVTEIDKSHLAVLAGCSRTFLYQNNDARKLITQAETRMKASPLKGLLSLARSTRPTGASGPSSPNSNCAPTGRRTAHYRGQ